MVKNIIEYVGGLLILIGFYAISRITVNALHIMFPPAILGLILFAISLISGIIKEKQIEKICNFLINNMAMFLVPFVGGLVVYKTLLLENRFIILLVIFITTTLIIVATGLYVEYGLKLVEPKDMRKTK